MNRKLFFYLFWITSNKGTDAISCRQYKKKPTKQELLSDLSSWGEQFACTTNSDSLFQIGYKTLKFQETGALIEKHNRAVRRKTAAEKELLLTKAMMSPMSNVYA